MADFATTDGSASDHPEICFTLDESSQMSVRWLIEYFSAEIAKGSKFVAGQSVQIGWMLTQLRAREDGNLELWEPEFVKVPIQWRRGVDTTLRHLIIQGSICEALECEPAFPALTQPAVVSPMFRHRREFTMGRDGASERDSGWVFAELGYKGPEAELQSLFQISLLHSDIIPFLALPTGAFVTKRDEFLEIKLKSKCVTSSENGLLKRLLNSAAF